MLVGAVQGKRSNVSALREQKCRDETTSSVYRSFHMHYKRNSFSVQVVLYALFPSLFIQFVAI